MITLRHFENKDSLILKKYKFNDKTLDEIADIINKWQELEYNGKYFEMFAVCNEDRVVGNISLYQHGDYIISIGPEIYAEFRRQNLAYEGMKRALNLAREKGYKIVSAQIRTDNSASINLHKKLGYILDGEYINKKGNPVYIYLKLL